ncbi:MAG TPA: vWA domain-containing protein, partial [Vicinamibacterales bacterium]|nr:vWA domain-containing protein [Vicinamibacterales bacterium]
MFRFLFRYPLSSYARGQFVLLSGWPRWGLLVSILAAAAGLAWLMRTRLPQPATQSQKFRAGLIWLLQSAMATLLLFLLWQPAITMTELKAQQDVIVFLVDDSRSMAIADDEGSSRLSEAVTALRDGVLTDVGKKFQTRLYRFDSRLDRIADSSNLERLQANAPATHIGDSLKQLVDETSDLPIGAIVLLSDGADNAGGPDVDTIAALRSRHIPVHTVGFGREHPSRDVEIDDAVLAPRALADSRLAAVISFHQYGFAGRKVKLTVRNGAQVLAGHDVTLQTDGSRQSDSLLFNVGAAGAKALQFSIDPVSGEENVANNAVTRLVTVEADRRRVLYIEGEPRWEYKFIKRAEEDDRVVQLISMLRTTENKIYRQGIQDPKELAEGFPTRPETLFGYQGLVIGS